MKYKNTSPFVKTFYGIEFQPGEVKDVCGNINDPAMLIVFESDAPKSDTPKEPDVKEPEADKVDSVITELAEDKPETAAAPEASPKSRKKYNKEG